VQVEPHRNIVASVGFQRSPVAPIEAVGALNDAAIVREYQPALMINAEQACRSCWKVRH
jgi:hypothetical protein